MTRFDPIYWEPSDVPVPEHDVSLEWVERTFSVSEREIRVLVREGFVSFAPHEGEKFFEPVSIRKIAFILALKRDMGVNLAGIEIILNLKNQLHWHISRFKGAGDPPAYQSTEGTSLFLDRE
ncbi:MAG: chaperone modulator CbpM [Leptospirales bacterium]